MEIGPGTERKANFGDTLRSSMGEFVTFRSVEPKATIELRDFD